MQASKMVKVASLWQQFQMTQSIARSLWDRQVLLFMRFAYVCCDIIHEQTPRPSPCKSPSSFPYKRRRCESIRLRCVVAKRGAGDDWRHWCECLLWQAALTAAAAAAASAAAVADVIRMHVIDVNLPTRNLPNNIVCPCVLQYVAL